MKLIGSDKNVKLINVHTENQFRGGKPASAFLDMFVIDLGWDKVKTSLSGTRPGNP